MLSVDGQTIGDDDTFADSFTSSTGEAYTGWVKLSAEIRSIMAASPMRCQHFSAVLKASGQSAGSTSTTSSIAPGAGFVLRKGPGSFHTLVVGSSALVAAQSIGLSMQAQTRLQPLEGSSTILASDGDSTAFLVAPRDVRRDDILSTASFACIMDWISGSAAVCDVPVPPLATFVEVRVSQTLMTPDSSVLQLSLLSATNSVTRSHSCGGPHGFAGQLPQDGACATYLPCFRGFMYGAPGDVGKDFSLRLSVPGVVGTGGICHFAFSATIVFTAPPIPVISTVCPYLCTSDRVCIDIASVCDGVADCGDGADEAKCNAFTHVDSDVNYGIGSFSAQVDSAADCCG